MAVVDRLEQFLHQLFCLPLRKRLVFRSGQAIEQLTTGTVFRHYVDHLGALKRFVILHNVRVIEFREDGDLVQDSIYLILDLVLGDSLDGYSDFLMSVIVSQEHLSKIASSQHLGGDLVLLVDLSEGARLDA